MNNLQPKPEILIHRYAMVYRMLDAEELDELAESIKRNGLREPIVLDKNGDIIDGRNRLRACERAGIEPRFETFQPIEREGLADDELEKDYLTQIADFIHDKNSARRMLSTGQKALAYAILYPEKEKPGPKTGKGISPQMVKLDIPQQRISDARDILAYAPGDVEAVKRGDEPFTKVAAKAKAIKAQQEPSESKVAAIEREDANLAMLVRRGDISLEAAEAEISVRKQRLIERRGKAVELLRQMMAVHTNAADSDFPAFLTDNLSDPIWRADVIRALDLNQDQVNAARRAMGPACENLSAFLKIMEGKF